MIRINLLPVREFRRKARAKRQVTIFFLAVAALLLVATLVHWTQSAAVADLKDEVKKLNDHKASLAKVAAQMKELEERKIGLKANLEIIDSLEKQRTGPVRLLDEMTRLVPPDQCWLTEFSLNGNSILLEGVATSNDTVSTFMKAMEASPLIQDVNGNTRQTYINELRLTSFSIKGVIETPEPAQEDKEGADKNTKEKK